MTRLVLVLHLDPALDVEGYQLAGRLANTEGVRSVEVVPLEDGDQLARMSTVREGIKAGLETWLERRERPEPYDNTPVDACPNELDDEARRESIAAYERTVYGNASSIAEVSAERRAELERERIAKRTAETLAQQDVRRRELEALDREAAQVAAERAHARRFADRGAVPWDASAPRACTGGCSRGGEGPACGRPGCY